MKTIIICLMLLATVQSNGQDTTQGIKINPVFKKGASSYEMHDRVVEVVPLKKDIGTIVFSSTELMIVLYKDRICVINLKTHISYAYSITTGQIL